MFDANKLLKGQSTGDWKLGELRKLKKQKEDANAQSEYSKLASQLGSMGSGVLDGYRYIDINFVPGVQLSDFVFSKEWSLSEKIALSTKILECIRTLVAAGVGHHDFHPGNLLYDEKKDEVNAIDFDAVDYHEALQSSADQMLIDIHYAAIELATGKKAKADERSMINSAGIIISNLFSDHLDIQQPFNVCWGEVGGEQVFREGYFLVSLREHNPALRNVLLDICKAMLDPKELLRPDVNSCISSLNVIRPLVEALCTGQKHRKPDIAMHNKV
ncbi:serine/threonine-protein kinase [uncultured Endozoicomonas sp.]|uniref:protein kinase domain-containing protein n=1 Tax=uncultured Endozoicomonas sp. TaxID=432652 RepID=UPI00262A5ED4|nr:serine/threonine-protein kinase [uncultured Endozoicomonas sp.]